MDELDKLVKRLGKLSAHARVGALNPKAAQKLAYAEFGTITVTARPVLSSTTDRNAGAIHRAIDKRIGDVLDGKDMSGEAILQDVGEDLAELVREKIAGPAAPGKRKLKPSTLASRRSRGNNDDTPLVDRSILESGEKALVDSIEVDAGPGSGVSPNE